MSPCASLRRTMIPNDFPSGGLQQSSVRLWNMVFGMGVPIGTVWIGRCAMVSIYSRISCLVGWFDDSCQICWYDLTISYLGTDELVVSECSPMQFLDDMTDHKDSIIWHIFRGAKLPASYCCFASCQWICFRLFPLIFCLICVYSTYSNSCMHMGVDAPTERNRHMFMWYSMLSDPPFQQYWGWVAATKYVSDFPLWNALYDPGFRSLLLFFLDFLGHPASQSNCGPAGTDLLHSSNFIRYPARCAGCKARNCWTNSERSSAPQVYLIIIKSNIILPDKMHPRP